MREFLRLGALPEQMREMTENDCINCMIQDVIMMAMAGLREGSIRWTPIKKRAAEWIIITLSRKMGYNVREYFKLTLISNGTEG